MTTIGLTGGIASGKSTVSGLLRGLGAKVIDADDISKRVTRPGAPAWRELVEAFGQDILNPDRTINRRRLGGKVFNEPAALKKLNDITHPRIVAAIKKEMDRGEKSGQITVIDAPLLIESGMAAMVDQVWVVSVDHQTQINRLMARDHFNEQEAESRTRAQLPLDVKKRYADRIIDNTGNFEQTKATILDLWNEVVARSK
ncbi:MAG TPA: dephospho-CoA kinase [Bacillota bacterium]